jgi:hypothetical protein
MIKSSSNLFKISTNLSFLCVYNSNYFQLSKKTKIQHAESNIKDIQYIELDQFSSNRIFIITSTHLVVRRYLQNISSNTKSYKLPIDYELNEDHFIKFVYNSSIIKFYVICRTRCNNTIFVFE